LLYGKVKADPLKFKQQAHG